MNQFLRHLTPGQQVGLLFVILFGLLLAGSVTVFVLSLRERDLPKARCVPTNSNAWAVCSKHPG